MRASGDLRDLHRELLRDQVVAVLDGTFPREDLPDEALASLVDVSPPRTRPPHGGRRSSGQGRGEVMGQDGNVPIDPLAPYGPLVETTVRVATWNVWGNFGPWPARAAHIESVLHDAAPDLVALQEVSRSSGEDAWPSLASALGLEYEPAMEWFEPLQMQSGTAILSRWPIERSDHRRVDGFDGADGAFSSSPRYQGPAGRSTCSWRCSTGDRI